MAWDTVEFKQKKTAYLGSTENMFLFSVCCSGKMQQYIWIFWGFLKHCQPTTWYFLCLCGIFLRNIGKKCK